MKGAFKNTILGDIQVVGTGQITIEIKNISWKIPQLQFILYFSKEDRCFTAFCIDLQMHYSHEDRMKALEGMHENILGDLVSISQRENRVEILQKILQEAPTELYQIYKTTNALFVNPDSSKEKQQQQQIYNKVKKEFEKKSRKINNLKISNFSLYQQDMCTVS